MKLKFWGVRGSIPTPLTPEQIKSRIAAVIMRVRRSDLESTESRRLFLESLPPYLYGTIGGNTTCIEIRAADNKMIIIDAGSGLRGLGASLSERGEKVNEFHIFFTHFHWDHLQGLPFFAPVVFTPGNKLFFYSPEDDLELILKGQMRQPYFPITMEMMNAELSFIKLEGTEMALGSTLIKWKAMRHPGGCYAYKITENEKSLIFATDSEITLDDFKRVEENSSFFEKVDLLILDAQYTLGEAIEKYDWGHTSYSMAIDFATEWGIKALALFHHEPNYTDRKIYSIHNSAEWYLARLGDKKLKLFTAVEGLEINL